MIANVDLVIEAKNGINISVDEIVKNQTNSIYVMKTLYGILYGSICSFKCEKYLNSYIENDVDNLVTTSGDEALNAKKQFNTSSSI